MMPTETEDLLDGWIAGVEKGFKYLDYWPGVVEYIVIKKEDDNTFVLLKDRSSVKKAGPFNKEAMEKLLGANRLIPYNNGSGWQIDFSFIKSGNCQCGAWATANPDCHARWCPKG